jgi:hypothetical protein
MLKSSDLAIEFELQAVAALQALLNEIPSVQIKQIERNQRIANIEMDILIQLQAFGSSYTLICEVKSSGQPRHVRSALFQLQRAVRLLPEGAVPILIAPFLSSESQALCREEEVGFLDLEGNCRLTFGGVFIERQMPKRLNTERRELRSIFKPKSAQVLRAMLRSPLRAWRVAELADNARVSFGHVSNVRTALIDREWAAVVEDGLILTKPGAVIDAWRNAYEPPAGVAENFYTVLHGGRFDNALRDALSISEKEGRAVLASFSAAQWLAPYARTGTQFLYADAHALKRVQDVLQLSSASKGENVQIRVLTDEGPLLDALEITGGIKCTSPVQTYLDLAGAGDRGQEAADHLREEKLQWRQ